MSRILIIGDSTVQWIRPYRNHSNDFTYFELLREQEFDIDIISTPGMTSKEVLNVFWNQLGGKFYDICIVSVGINDACPRNYPRFLWSLDNKLLVKDSILSKVFSFIYRLFTNSAVQRACSQLGLSRPWISSSLFKRYLFKFQEIVLKESDAKIIYLSLPLTSNRVSSVLYNINKNISEYKNVMQELTDNKRVFTLDVNELFENENDKYNTEGIHYTSDGHKKVFEALYKLIKEVAVK